MCSTEWIRYATRRRKKMGSEGLSPVCVTTQDEGRHMEGLLVDVEECSVSIFAWEIFLYSI
jgi:hypothetical protein